MHESYDYYYCDYHILRKKKSDFLSERNLQVLVWIDDKKYEFEGGQILIDFLDSIQLSDLKEMDFDAAFDTLYPKKDEVKSDRKAEITLNPIANNRFKVTSRTHRYIEGSYVTRFDFKPMQGVRYMASKCEAHRAYSVRGKRRADRKLCSTKKRSLVIKRFG